MRRLGEGPNMSSAYVGLSIVPIVLHPGVLAVASVSRFPHC